MRKIHTLTKWIDHTTEARYEFFEQEICPQTLHMSWHEYTSRETRDSRNSRISVT